MELTEKQVLDLVIHSILDNVHTAIPGVFTAYDPTTKKASVQPAIQKIIAANGKSIPLPIIQNVPVIWSGTSKAIIHLEITPGKDGCLLLFSERSLENWLSSDAAAAGTSAESAALPGDPRQFDFSDAIAIPGLFSFINPGMVPITGKGVEIINGKAYIQVDDSENIVLKNENGQFKLDGATGQFNVNNGNLTVDP